MTSLLDMDDGEIVAYVRGCVRDFEGYSGSWRDEARDAYEFAAGRQWSADDVAYLKEQNRPYVTFNRVGKFLDAICGTEANNKMEWNYSVGGVEDSAGVDLMTKVVKMVSAEDAESETTASFRDMLTCGYGWTDTKIDYTESMEGQIITEHIDPMQAGWEPRARKRNLSDARWVFRVKVYDKDALDEEWEGASKKVESAGQPLLSDKQSLGSLMDAGEYDFDDGDDGGDDTPSETSDRKRYTVICFQQMAIKEMVIAVNPITNEPETLTTEKFDEVQEKLGTMGLSVKVSAKKKQRVWHHVYICGNTKLADVQEVPCRSLEVMTGKWDRNKRYYYGIVRAAKDPQQWENKFMSNIMHIISSQGKGVMVEEDAIPVNDWRTFEATMSRPDKIKRVAAGAISQNKIKAPDPVPLPAGLAELMTRSAAAVPDVLGISPEFLGLAGRTQSGVVEKSRRQAGLAVVSEFFQSRREHIKRTGRIMISYVLEFMPDSLFIRVGGEEAATALPQLRKADFARYDVRVDEAPVSPDQKAELWADIVQLAPVIIPMGLPPEFWLAALEYSAWPASLVRKLSEALSQPNPQAEQAAQLELEQKGADVEETKSKTLLNEAKAQAEGQPDMGKIVAAKVDAEKAQMEAGFKREEHGMKLQQLAAQTQAKQEQLGAQTQATQATLGVQTQAHIIKGMVDMQKAKTQSELPARKGSSSGR
jgi:portal protein